MEVLAGDDDLTTTVRENGAAFRLDYRAVYWNSRLEREHRRVVQMLAPTDVVCDMFAGIGPFAVPAAARGCRVYANDLNPHSVQWLRTNVDANRVAAGVRVSNEDGRAFVRRLLRAGGGGGGGSGGELEFGEFAHVLMNLPASALEFLDVFVRAFDAETWRAPLPRVHCYCFSKETDAAADVIGRAEAVMGCALPGATAHVVRDVAPAKLMLCLSFTIPDEIGWAHSGDDAEGEAVGADAKRRRTEDM